MGILDLFGKKDQTSADIAADAQKLQNSSPQGNDQPSDDNDEQLDRARRAAELNREYAEARHQMFIRMTNEEVTKFTLEVEKAAFLEGKFPEGVPGFKDGGRPLPFNDLPSPTATGAFRLEVQDAFAINGRGTVVTGCVESGVIHIGDLAFVRGASGDLPTTIKGIEAFRSTRDFAQAGDNIGLLLEGIDRNQVSRGDTIVSR